MVTLLGSEPITSVSLKIYPFLTQRTSQFRAYCRAINAKCEIEVIYDGRDARIRFPEPSISHVTKKCQLIVGLFHKKSNFQEKLLKAYWFMDFKQQLRRIYFELDDITLLATKNSNPEELMRKYFRKSDYIVFKDDTESKIIKRDEELLGLYSLIYNQFLKEADNSDLEKKKNNIYFLSSKAEESYLQEEAKIYDERFLRFLRTYKLGLDTSYENKELLDLLKKWLHVC